MYCKTKLTFEVKIEQKGLLFSFGEQKFEFLGRVPNFPYSFFQIESNFRLLEKRRNKMMSQILQFALRRNHPPRKQQKHAVYFGV